MRRYWLHGALCVFVVAGIAAPTRAQPVSGAPPPPAVAPPPEEQDLINADRPGLADTSSVIAARQVQIETGLQYERRDHGDEGTLFFPTLVRIGLGHRLEARFEGNTFSSVSQGQTFGGGRVSGFAPLSLGFEFNVRESTDERHPGVGVITRVVPAWGSGDFRANRVAGDVRLAVDWEFAPQFSLNPNAGFGVYESDGANTFAAGLFAVTLAYARSPKLNLFIDMGAQVPEMSHGRSSIIIDGGVAYIIGQNIQIDVSIGTGVHGDTAPHPFVGVGFSIRSTPRVR